MTKNISLKTFKLDHNNPLVYSVIDKIAKDTKIIPFGYQSTEDIRQDIWVICINALKEWVPEKISEDTKSIEQAVEKFLRVTVHNRLINRFKEVTKTVKSPCPRCKYYSESVEGNCKKFGEDKERCSKYSKYIASIASRNDLLNIVDETDDRNYSEEWDDNLIASDLAKNIMENLSDDLKIDFKNMVEGKNISKKALAKIRIVAANCNKGA